MVWPFLPRDETLYQGFKNLPGGGPRLGNVVEARLLGRVPTLPHALVVTDQWWYYVAYLAALQCPTLDCDTVFAYGADSAMRRALRRAYPDRDWYDLRLQDGVLNAVPSQP